MEIFPATLDCCHHNKHISPSRKRLGPILKGTYFNALITALVRFVALSLA
ncbi:hypothetical protein DEDE109153_03055 [Deinococcus deserti]